MTAPGRNNVSEKHWTPFSMAVLRLRALSVGMFGSLVSWTVWESRECASTGGAGSEAYKDMI